MDVLQTKTEVPQDRRSVELLRRQLEMQQQIIDQLQKTNGQLQQTIRRLKQEIDRLKERLGQYEPEVLGEKHAGAVGPDASQYSVAAEEKRRQRKKKKKTPGRRPTHLKFSEADRFEDVYPPHVPPDQCRLVRQRAVWRLIDNRAVRVGYRIYSAPAARSRPSPASRRVASMAWRFWSCSRFWFISRTSPWIRPMHCWRSFVSYVCTSRRKR